MQKLKSLAALGFDETIVVTPTNGEEVELICRGNLLQVVKGRLNVTIDFDCLGDYVDFNSELTVESTIDFVEPIDEQIISLNGELVYVFKYFY